MNKPFSIEESENIEKVNDALIKENSKLHITISEQGKIIKKLEKLILKSI